MEPIEEHPLSPAPDAGAAAPPSGGHKRALRLLRRSVLGALAVVVVFAGGFGVFATHVSHLVTPSNPSGADAIIVLTGGQARLDAAVGLLKSGKGKRLLISGVHPAADRDDIRKATGGDRRLFSCCIDIDHAALDTIGNAEESAKWVKNHDYGKVILVTNNYHMPRSLLEMGRLLDKAEVEPYPVVNTPLDDGGWLIKPDALRVMFLEYNKYLLSLARGVVPLRPTPEGIRMVNAGATTQ